MKKIVKWLKKNWKDERKKAAIKLGLYFVMMLFIILLMVILNSFAPKKEMPKENTVDTVVEEEPIKEPLTFQEMIDNILKNNYAYNYEITNDISKVIYKGVKFQDKEYGTKEDSNSLMKYYIDTTGTYKIVLNEKNLIHDLYLNIDQNYLDFSHIYNLIKSAKTIKEVVEDLTINHYTIVIDSKEVFVNLYYDKSRIKEIKVEIDNTIYDLTYDKIGEILESYLGD